MHQDESFQAMARQMALWAFVDGTDVVRLRCMARSPDFVTWSAKLDNEHGRQSAGGLLPIGGTIIPVGGNQISHEFVSRISPAA